MTEHSLKRSITWVQGTALTIGAVLGCGILVLPSITANNAGPASLLSWILMSLISFPIVLTIAHLAQIMPSAGGIAAYVERAFGPMTSSVLSWIMLGSIPVGVPIVALTGAFYVNDILPVNIWEVIGMAALILAVSLFLHVRGIELSAKVGLGVICGILGLLITAVAVSAPYIRRDAFTPFVPDGWLSVGSASVIIFFSFVGWEMIVPLAEEFKNPEKDIFVSLLLGAFCIAILYISVSFVTVGTHSYGGKKEIASLSILISKGLGTAGAALTTVLALFITFSSVHANIAGFSRMVYAQARGGNFPAFFAALHPQHRTPVRVLAVLGAIFGIVLILYGWVRPDLGTLLKGPSAVFITSYILTMLAALKILRPLTIGWLMAFLSLTFSVILLFFSGWAILYPAALSALGVLYLRKRTRQLKAGGSV
ncbi:APC family permease [Sporolactobacillus sp. KGMB 08714]|uniref:APC family permease n=1 Tax=Sporolactobacillus sp. KGMB 08714 TaxID=3064704 RepID=UPI002FBE1119